MPRRDNSPREQLVGRPRREPELLLGRSDWGLQYEIVGELAKQLLNQKVPEDAARPGDDRPPASNHDEDDKSTGPEQEEDKATEPEEGTDMDIDEGEESSQEEADAPTEETEE